MRESDITRTLREPEDIEHESKATSLSVFNDTKVLGGCFADLTRDEFCAGFAQPLEALSDAPRRVALSAFGLPENQQNSGFMAVMAGLLDLLRQSPTGRGLLENAIDAGVTVGCDPLQSPSRVRCYAARYGLSAHIDFGNYSGFDGFADKTRARLFAGLIAGLRRSWHDQQASAPDLRLLPEQYLEHTRLMLADSEALMHLVAWELRGCGESLLWHSLIAGASADIASTFEQSVACDAQNQFNGTALKAAFNQWFACAARVNAAEQLALETLDAALVTDMALMWSSSGLCRQEIMRDDLSALGNLPCGQNYLAGCRFTSGWYAGLHDSGNRAHLRHLMAELATHSAN